MVRREEFVARIGPSGSGKSTLLNIIELLDRPTRGRLFIEGQGTSKLNDTWITKLRSHSIGLVYQYHYLGSAFTAIENVMMPLLVDHAFPTNDMHQRARDLLAQVGLTQWQNNWLVPSKPRAELGAMPARKSTTARIQKNASGLKTARLLV
jgi:lipoprotein-releasing system ATP-binding protein